MQKLLGKIQFIRDKGVLHVGQNFNPHTIPRSERVKIADELREIASCIENDKFEVDGVYEVFKAPAEPVQKQESGN